MNMQMSIKAGSIFAAYLLTTAASFNSVSAQIPDVDKECTCDTEFGISKTAFNKPVDSLHLGNITQRIDTVIVLGSGKPAQISHVIEHNLYGINPFLGGINISYDSASPAPPCTLYSYVTVNGSPVLFPGFQVVHTAWIATVDSLPGQIFRTITPITLVSDTLWDWPTVNMKYTIVTDAYFEDVNNPGDTVFEMMMSGDRTIISHVATAIPTLTEWGMIIFILILFGWMVWVIVKRRRNITVGV